MKNGDMQMNFPGKSPEDMVEVNDAGEAIPLPTCSLDVADSGENTLEDVGACLNVTRERVRQIESAVLRKIQASRKLGKLFDR